MASHRVRRPVQEAIVEALVIREIKSQLLQPVLQIPVDFGEQQESRHRRSRLHPEFGAGQGRRDQLAPGPFEDFGQHEHRHVAADAVGVLGQRLQLADHGPACFGLGIVELRDVGPRRKIRVAAARDEPHALVRRDGPKSRRITPYRLLRCVDEPIGVRGDPWMIEPDVIRDEIDDQLHPSRMELGAHLVQLLHRPDVRIRLVRRNAVRGADDSVGPPAGKHAIVCGQQARVRERDLPAERAAPPHAHQVDCVHAAVAKGIPLFVGHRPERDPPAVAARQRLQPGPGIDFVEMRVGAQVMPRVARRFRPGRRGCGWCGTRTRRRRARG